MTQAALATRVGISRQTVIDLEQGKNVSSYMLMAALAGLGKGLQVTSVDRPTLDEVRELFNEDQEHVDGKNQDAARRNAPGRRR